MPPLIIPEPDDVNSGLGSGLFREAGYHSSIRLSMLSLFGGLLPGWHHWWPQSTGQHRRTQPVSSFCSACQGSAPTPAGLNRPMRLLAVGIMEKWPPKKTCVAWFRGFPVDKIIVSDIIIYIYLYYNHIYIYNLQNWWGRTPKSAEIDCSIGLQGHLASVARPFLCWRTTNLPKG